MLIYEKSDFIIVSRMLYADHERPDSTEKGV
jgi:hypothetical protein